GAPLSGITECRAKRPRYRIRQIRIVADDERIFSTELETDLGKTTARSFGNPAADLARTGEAHDRDVSMLDQRRACFLAETVKGRVHTVRDTRLTREHAKRPCRERRVFCGLENRRVATQERRQC